MRSQFGLWVALILGIAACPAADSSDPQNEGVPCADSSAACAPGDTDADTDGNTGTTPPGAECVSDSDCAGFCGSCNAGVCQEDVGCCGAQAGDETRFRCSEDGSTFDDDGSDGESSSGSDGSGSGSGDTGSGTSGTSGSDSGTAGSDTGDPTSTTAG